MLSVVHAERFIRPMGNGRTRPCLIECVDDNGNSVEVVVKCSTGCFEKEKNLALEAISAMLAADLDLPVPEPFIVKIDEEFIAILDDNEIRSHMRNSCSYAFGSKFTPSFSAWLSGQEIPNDLTTVAAEIFVFDAIVINSDRRPTNPNCLFRGNDIAIIDHELTFIKVLTWTAPWLEDGFNGLTERDNHIFSKQYYRNVVLQLDRFIKAWEDIDVNRFQQYKNALPKEWLTNQEFIDEVINYLETVKANIRGIVDNALRAFK